MKKEKLLRSSHVLIELTQRSDSWQRHQLKVQEIENSFNNFLPYSSERRLCSSRTVRAMTVRYRENWPYCWWMMTMLEVQVACLTFQFTSYFQSLVILITFWLRCNFPREFEKIKLMTTCVLISRRQFRPSVYFRRFTHWLFFIPRRTENVCVGSEAAEKGKCV